jgi:hypothetical protein
MKEMAQKLYQISEFIYEIVNKIDKEETADACFKLGRLCEFVLMEAERLKSEEESEEELT